MATKKTGNKRGRPSSYREEYAKQAEKLCKLGATDAQMADFFGVSAQTLNAWKHEFPDFLDALNSKEAADANVQRSLYQRALGYSHPEEKIFIEKGQIIRADTIRHYPPDVTACIFWLKNRQPEQWREKPTPADDDAEVLPVKVVVEVIDASAPAE